MSAPWLSDLSEDWKTPSSTHSSSLPRRSAAAAASSTNSRIPRSTQRLATPVSERRFPRSTPANSKRTLSERSRSDINIPSHSSPAQRHAKSATSRLSRSSSTSASSADSVVRLDAAARKARSSSLVKPKSNTGTPEWRKLVMKAQNNPAHANLFSTNPVGLEGIFQKPNSATNDGPAKSHPSFSFLQDLESMPSSPPPWPKSYRPSHLAANPGENVQARDSFGVVQEQDEPGPHQNPAVSSSAGEDQPQLNADSPDPLPSIETRSTSMRFVTGVDGSCDVEPPSKEVGGQQFEHDRSNSNINFDSHQPESNPPRASSSVGSGFSPVFISKHNGADGGIDYAAVDLSNPDVLDRLRESRGFQTSSANRSKAANDDQILSDDLPNFNESNSTANNPWNRHALAPIGEYVSMGRGGRSDESSFMHRPLSPSASSSIVPSDSVSQVHGTQNGPQKSFAISDSQNRIVKDHLTQAKFDRDSAVRTGSTLNRPALARCPETDPGQQRTSFHSNDILESKPVYHGYDATSGQASGTDGSVKTVLDRSISKHNNPDVAGKSVPAQPSGFSSSSSGHSEPFDLASSSMNERPSTPQHNLNEPLDVSPSKRPAPLASKSPTPKRLRTLSELEHGPHPEYVSNQVEEQHRRMQAIIGKRKDARYDDYSQACDPEALARREILRPRNLSTVQQRSLDEVDDSFNESINSNSTLKTVQEHIEQAALNCNADDEAEIKALASEVATFRLRGLQSANGEVRKQSVSTQDYVDEAMKIMELIRSKRVPPAALSDLEEYGSDPTAQVDDVVAQELTPQTISRPPSREGVINAWRTKDSQPLNSEVASQLQRYQEVGDESFAANSAFGDWQGPSHALPDGGHEQSPVDEESADIRIFGRFKSIDDHLDANFEQLATQAPLPQSPAKTFGSNKSTDSSGRTVETTSTQKTRTLPAVIAPNTVSHLLRAEEAGMRYDPDRQTWVKCKNSVGRPDTAGHFSSSADTEDDPFGAISDLSVDDTEAADERVGDADQFHNHIDRSELENLRYLDLDDGQSDAKPEADATFAEESSPDSKLPNLRKDEKPADVLHHSRAVLPLDEDFEDVSRIPESVPSSLNRLSKAPTRPVQSKRREVSVLFSSPPVSKQYAPQLWSDSGEQSDPDESVLVHAQLRSASRSRNLPKQPLVSRPSPNRGVGQAGAGFNPFSRELSLSCIDEHHEISFIGTQADGRSMSLTLSVSTPLPSHRHSSRPIIHSSGFRNSNIWSSLSPLSEFSFHQDDARHLRARQLSGVESQQLIVPNRSSKTAVVVENLVQKLTDVEPDEPYWDFMRALHLGRKEIDNLHMLDEFCPRIEELDVSDNELQQLNGAPPGIRQLDVRDNRLSSLSSWDHLANLQYLDISGNVIESLEGLSSLVHLRELRADDNNITSLEGLLDLDGLISLSIKRNRLEVLDFQGAEMKRLSVLNVEGNCLHRVSNVHCTPLLSQLDLSNNKLVSFPCQELDVQSCQSLQMLRVANNMLEVLDVARFPNLRMLDADNNRLTRIDHVKKLEHLCSLFARSQKPPLDHSTESIGDHLDDFNEVHHLYLSGNFIPSLDIKTAFLNLQTFELAFGGVHSLPVDFGILAPNLRVVNLNSNALKDLRPLRGIKKLSKLFVAANRLSRLRKAIKVLGTLPCLQEVDVRDNPLTLGYYPLLFSGQPRDQNEVARLDNSHGSERQGDQLRHLLPSASSVSGGDGEAEILYVERLEEDTRLRRRLYELLLAAKCPMLDFVDGRHFETERVFRIDDAWEQLVELGIVERVDGN